MAKTPRVIDKQGALEGRESVEDFKRELQATRSACREQIRREDDGLRIAASFTASVDALLGRIFEEHLAEHCEQVCVLAVGGYGRRHLCPHSDVDLLILRQSTAIDPALQSLVRTLWDCGFDLGHSVRTIAECRQFMGEDEVTATALLENRWLYGSQNLYQRFRSSVVERYRRRHGESFARRKFRNLRDSIERVGRTFYVLEPHLKEGKCGLRDIQQVLWIEAVRHEAGTFSDLEGRGTFSVEQVRGLRDAYAFYLRVRSQNHLTNGLRQDVLDSDSVISVARELGYGEEALPAVEGLMADYYRHARETHRFLRYYIETGTRGRTLFRRISRALFGTRVNDNLLLWKGALYPDPLDSELGAGNGGGPGEQRADLEEGICEVFVIAHERDARLSARLRERIRTLVADPRLDFTHSSVIARGLLKILRGGVRTGRTVKALHDTGVLGRIIPEFAKLDGLVHFDGHHQFTVDEHILRTLELLDSIADGSDEAAPEFGQVFQDIEDPLSLRLALLLHDIGKALPGADHAVSGSEAASLICVRLGVSDSVREAVEFLVYHHLALFSVSERHDISEPGAVEGFARLVGSVDRLRMLYLLTYIDIRAVGSGTWTSWKGVQLAEVFERTRLCLECGETAEGGLEELLAASQIDGDGRRRVREHCERVDTPDYEKAVLPERMLQHVDMVDRARRSKEVQVEHEPFVGYSELIVCAFDRANLFTDLTGLLHSEGLDVLRAMAFSRDDGVAIDAFFVAIADEVRVSIAERVERLRRKLQDVEARKVVVEDFIRQWLRVNRYRADKQLRKSLYGALVAFDNEQSDLYTVIELRAGDRPGLLHDVACTLGQLGLDLRKAKVSTVGSRVLDAFWVVEQDGEKVTNPARRTQIERELIACAARPSLALASDDVYKA